MLLSEIFEHLHFGELSKLNIGSKPDGAIQLANYPEIISFINLAMIDLYKKFPLREKQVIIQQYSNITNYVLTYDFAVTNTDSTEPFKYIQDSVQNVFGEDVLQIQEVFDELGDVIPLNNLADTASFFTPGHNILQIPYPNDDNAVALLYRAYPTKIPLAATDPTLVNVNLPYQLLEALLAYVGYRAHLSLPKGDGATGASSYSRYMNICQDVKDLGTINKDYRTNYQLVDNGWV